MSGNSVDPTPKPLQDPWKEENKIVIGIDIGTTQSGVAFTYLQIGVSPVVHRVKRWPGQEAREQQGKIPTLVWYDTNKKAVSFGAEALSFEAEVKAEENNWILAKHFKLHLHPDDMPAKHDLKLDPLPPGVHLQQIYSDFLGYLLKHTQTFFADCIIGGKQIWENYRSKMEFVIAHPNGWGIREQTFLRGAAVGAGFTNSEESSSRIRFLAEAEASVHYCIYHTNLGSRLQPGTNFAVCDAGGSTVDTTLYSVMSLHPVLKLKEQRASACVQAGAIFVDSEVEQYMRKTLTRAGLPQAEVDEYTKAGVKDFEGNAKRAFHDVTTEHHVEIAHFRFNNTPSRVRRGRMALDGSTIKGFFDVCCKEILSSVDNQLGDLTVPYILLVGGFGDSPYLRDEFKRRYEPRGCQITRTNDSTSKAVADGAVIWSIISSVFSRAPRYSFGAICAKTVLPWTEDSDIEGRDIYIGPHGLPIMPGAWSQIVHKGVALDSEVICRDTFSGIYRAPNPDLKSMTMDLYAYSGDDEPEWAWDPAGRPLPGFRKVCVIKGDLRNLEGALERNMGLLGSAFWSLKVDVCIHFGGTELKAYMEWEEKNGTKHKGPVEIIPEEPVEI